MGVGMPYKTQSPESALPKELLRVSREGRGPRRRWRGVISWLQGLIAKKDMSRLLITQVHTRDNNLILSSSLNWSILPLHHRTPNRHTDPDTGPTNMCYYSKSAMDTADYIKLSDNYNFTLAGCHDNIFDTGANMTPRFRLL